MSFAPEKHIKLRVMAVLEKKTVPMGSFIKMNRGMVFQLIHMSSVKLYVKNQCIALGSLGAQDKLLTVRVKSMPSNKRISEELTSVAVQAAVNREDKKDKETSAEDSAKSA